MYQEYKAAWAALTAPGADFEVITTNVRGVDIKTYANAVSNLRDAWLPQPPMRTANTWCTRTSASPMHRLTNTLTLSALG